MFFNKSIFQISMESNRYFLIVLLFISLNITAFSQKTYRILALGDVITTGNSTNGIPSYLFPLWEKLFAAGYIVEFVGPNSTTTRIGTIKQAAVSNETGTAETIDATISNTYNDYQADVVLIHAGHNHDVAENPIPSIIAAHKSIISKIRAINPNVKICVAQVIAAGKLPKYSYIPDLNIQIANMANEYATANNPITLVNMVDGFSWQTDCVSNMVHPNAIGADKIATKWVTALKTVLDKPEESYSPEIVTYKKPTGDALKLHIFRPTNVSAGEKRAAIVYFFGGGWTNGTPLQFYRESYYWASKGMVAVCADYRIQFTHGTTPVESIKDAKSVIRWLRANADAYGIDPDRICASGASAGGHLAAATGTLKLWDESNENLAISSKPNLLLLNYPVYDNGPTGYGPADFRTQYLTVSPMHNIDKTMPPCLVFLGTADANIPVSTAQLFQQKMKDVGVESELILYQGAVHPIFLYQKGKSTDYYSILAQSEAYLTKHNYLGSISGVPSTKISTSTFNVSPNPASDFFRISGLNTVRQISIRGMDTKLVASVSSENRINVENFPNGIYFLSIDAKIHKLIVKH